MEEKATAIVALEENVFAVFKLFCKDRLYFTKFYEIVHYGLTNEIHKLLLETIKLYYEEFTDHTYISCDDFRVFFDTTFKHHKGYQAALVFIDVVFDLQTSSDTAAKLVLRIAEHRLYRSIDNILLKQRMREEPDAWQDIVKEIDSYRELMAAKKKESPFFEVPLADILAEDARGDGLRWRLKCLNDDMGPLTGSTLGHIFARPECFSKDTEVLTPHGWKYVDQVSYQDRIACVDGNRNITFEHPSHVECHKETEMFAIEDTLGRVQLCVSGGHNMVYEYGQGGLRKKQARDIKYFQGVKHHTAGTGTGSREFTAFDALQIAYQADGHTRNYKEYGYTFSFKKKEKIKRLKAILDELQFEYTVYKDGNKGHFGFYVKTDRPLSKTFDWLLLDSVSEEYAKAFIEELRYWDGSIRTSTRFKFDTTSTVVADKVQAIAALANCNCFHSVYEDTRELSYKDTHTLTIRTNYKPVDGQSINKTQLVNFDDYVYCFTVSTGMLLVRRNNAVAVCGNTGKTTLIASEVTNFCEQIAEDECIIWINNEEAGKKVMTRVMQSALRASKDKILINQERALAVYATKIGSKFRLVDEATITFEQIYQIVQDFKPKVLVVDQGDKVRFRGDNLLAGHERLKALYVRFRELAKEFDIPIITVGQASGEAEGKKWLSMDVMDNSKTGKPGEMDWIIGIGTTNAEGEESIRYLRLAKNKLTGKHSKHSVLIDTECGRYADMG